MYQAFLTEKANFFAHHGHLPEQERQRLWKQRIDRLDEQVLVDQATSPNLVLDAGSPVGRRLSVSGTSRFFSYQPRMTQSAPPSFYWPANSEFEDVSASSPAAFSDSCKPSSIDGNFFSFYGQLEESNPTGDNLLFDMAPSSAIFTTEGDVQNGLATQQEFGPNAHLSLPSSTTSFGPHEFYYTVVPPGQQDGLVDTLLNHHPRNSPPSCELTFDSPLSSDMSRQNSAVSSVSTQPGGVVYKSLASTFSCNALFPSVFPDGASSSSFISPPFRFSSSVSANDPVICSIDELPSFYSPTFNLSGEGVSPLPNPPTSDYNASTKESVIRNDDIPPNRTSVLSLKCQPNTMSMQQDLAPYTARPLAPKVLNLEATSSSTCETNGGIIPGLPSNKRKLAITKSSYIRPKHPKKYCSRCTEHPEGFRGDHELKRHVDRAHNAVRKMWICVDSSPDGKFLDHCKKCKNGKRYGAYYNAAAHLRRAHFNKRQKARGRGKSNEKRGGAGGGEWPSMEVLKNWMKEVEDQNQDNISDTSTDDEYQSNPVLNANQFEPCTPPDCDETLYEYSSYSLKPRDQATSVAQRDRNVYPLKMPMSPFETVHPPYLLPDLKHAGKVPLCRHSLDQAYFPPTM